MIMKRYLKIAAYAGIIITCVISISSCVANANADPAAGKNVSPLCATDQPAFTEQTARALIEQWGKGLKWQGTDSDLRLAVLNIIADNYANNAVLLPTLSNKILTSNQNIYGYFYGSDKPGFMAKKPQMKLDKIQGTKALSCGYGSADGDYTFSVNSPTSGAATINARFTFVYKYFSNPEAAIFIFGNRNYKVDRKPGWYIVTHHSSIQPTPSNINNYDQLKQDFSF